MTTFRRSWGVVPAALLALAAWACGGDDAGSGATSSTSAETGVDRSHDVQGGGLAAGLVTGRIYDDLSKNLGATMRDFRTLGVKVLRVEIEGTDYARYRAIVDAAERYGIQVLALVAQAATSDPLAPSFDAFQGTFVPGYIATVERLLDAVPALRYVEVWNEPDVYGFRDIGEGDHAYRYALLATRVFEYFHEKAAQGGRAPTLLAFDFSRQDDGTLRDLVYNQEPITNHRRGYRPGRLPDGLPADIVSIHGYGTPGVMPATPGYAYGGRTLDEAVSDFLDARFATKVDGWPDGYVVNQTAVWYTEIGYGWRDLGEAQQADAVGQVFATLRAHPQITAAFWYDYRDDEPGGGETSGLRGNSTTSYTDGCGVARPYAPHASYSAFARAAGGDSRSTFVDVPPCHWAHDAIEALFARGITIGCNGGSLDQGTLAFCEGQSLTRGELGVFLARAQGQPTGEPTDTTVATRADMGYALARAVGAYQPVYQGYFVDVGADHPYVHEIEGLYERKITTGWELGGGRHEFRPNANLTRSEMAVFLSRAFALN